jgi:hypothetical protein
MDILALFIPYIPLILVALIIIWLFNYSQNSDQPLNSKNMIVRCQEGHLFTTVWIPFVSFKAVRLGAVRFQYCPIGQHWSLVQPVDVSSLSDEERHRALNHRDSDIP